MTELRAGNYVCVQSRGLYGDLIRAFTRSQFSHSFVYLGDGEILQADSGGLHVDKITRYRGAPAVANLSEPMTVEQRAAVCGAARSFVGDSYGWQDIAVIALRHLGIRTAWLDRVADDRDALICSETVAKAGLAAGLDWRGGEGDPAFTTPGDLASRPGMVPVSI